MTGAPRRAGDSRNSQVIHLLNELGDRLVRSEKERFTVRAELASTRETLARLENRAEKTERVFLTIQDRINKQEGIESRLLKRQEELERLTRENIQRLERAELLTGKIEEAIILQNRLARRLERTAQDKARILSKIERIESSIAEAQDIFAPPSAPRPSTVIPHPANNDAPPAATPWWKAPLGTQIGIFSSVLAGGILAGLAVSQLIAHWPQPAPRTGEPAVAAVTPAPAQHTGRTVMTTDPDALSAYGDMRPEDAALFEEMERDPDAVAARMNAIEPSAVTPPQADSQGAPVTSAVTTPETPAQPSPPSAPVAGEEPVLRKEAPAQKQDQAIAAFISNAVDTSRPLRDRITPDATLPPVIKQIEAKAYDGIPEAQHDLAAIYTAGHGGVKVSYEKAAAWFQEASVNGVGNARYNLGVLYHQGLGVPRDIGKAINWYRAAAALGHPEAQYNLGIAYIEGIGTEYDPRVAASHFESAARAGVLEAAYNLGLIHENGLLGTPDMNEAVFWYKLSSDHNPEARVAFDQIVRAMSLKPGDITRIVKEYGAVYGFDAEGRPLPSKAIGAAARPAAPPQTATPVSAAPLRAEDQVTPAAPPVSLNDIPPLGPEESKNLLKAMGKDHVLVSQIQEQLVRLGLYPGPADGIGGPQTEDAIRSYQSRNGLSVTGKPTEELLVHMLATELNAAAGE